jgi:hypothetical protein
MYFANTQTEYRYSWQVYVIVRYGMKTELPKFLKPTVLKILHPKHKTSSCTTRLMARLQ